MNDVFDPATDWVQFMLGADSNKKGLKIRWTEKPWKSDVVKVGRTELCESGTCHVELITCVPLQPKAIVLLLVGPSHAEAELYRTLGDILATLDGEAVPAGSTQSKGLDTVSRMAKPVIQLAALCGFVVFVYRRFTRT